MTTVEILWAVATAYATIWASYVLLIPLLAVLRGSTGALSTSRGNTPAIVVIVPAHNMSSVIERCVNSLQANDYPMGQVDIYVVADHCTDDTSARARSSGASVLVRDDGPAGKTYTLAWTLEALKERNIDPDLYAIVDATARVDTGFLGAMVALWQQGENMIVSHPVVDAANQKWFAKCLGLTLAHRNVQNWSRQRLGLSAFIEGRGMAYSRAYVQRYGWSLAVPTSSRSGSHPTEDWRHGVQAVEQGNRVAFADDARVITPLRDSLTAATKQGVRWERGRMANAASHAVRLLIRGIRKRNSIMVLAALDAIQPPVAILGALCVGLAAFSVFSSSAHIGAGLIPLTLVGLYGVIVVVQGHKDGIHPSTVLWTPVYLTWRCVAFILAWGFLDRLDLSTRRKKRKDA
jgi:cellulose synthase/poly-beta-1,6-N-acetylglucosamine synthase-like glycosyltransferase